METDVSRCRAPHRFQRAATEFAASVTGVLRACAFRRSAAWRQAPGGSADRSARRASDCRDPRQRNCTRSFEPTEAKSTTSRTLVELPDQRRYLDHQRDFDANAAAHGRVSAGAASPAPPCHARECIDIRNHRKHDPEVVPFRRNQAMSRSCRRSNAGLSSAMRIETRPSAGFSSRRCATATAARRDQRAEYHGLALCLLQDGAVVADLRVEARKRCASMKCSSVRSATPSAPDSCRCGMSTSRPALTS